MYNIFLAVVLFLIFSVIRYVLQVRRSRLYELIFQYPPCFHELPLVGSAYHFQPSSSEDALKTIMEAGYNTIKAGGITRIYGFNKYFLVMTDASSITEVLTRCLNKERTLYGIFRMISGNGSVFVPEYSISKVRRHALLPSFSSRMLSNCTESIWRSSVELTDILAPFVGKGPFAAGPYIGAFCFNSVISLANVPEIRREVCTMKLLNDFHRSLRLIYERLFNIWMHPDFLHKQTLNYAEIQRHTMFFQALALKGLALRKNRLLDENTDTTSDTGIFDGLMDSKLLSPVEIGEEIVVMIGASEESATVIGFALTLLGLYPAVQDKVYEELAFIFSDTDRPLQSNDLARMHYLDLLVKEVLRLFPSAPLILREAHKEIKLSSGRVVPTGAGIAVPIISLHRNPVYWGPDADHFDPERFLPERLATVPDHAYIPFSYGPRSCPGYKLASYLVKLGLCAILRRYKVVGTPAAGPVPHIRTKFEVVLRPVNDFEIELVNRT